MGNPAQTAEECIGAGNIAEALDALKNAIRSDPSDSGKRVFLFQLYAVLGQWDKAVNQLSVAAELDPEAGVMAQVAHAAVACEKFREAVYAGERTPLVLGEPAEWIGWMVQAVGYAGKGQHDEAAALRAQAFEQVDTISGRVCISHGEEMATHEFEWIADADERLGPIIEAVVDGKFYWIPMSHIRQIRMDTPSDLRDVVWAPAEFTWSTGGEGVGLIPTRYPGSEKSEDNAIRLARKTEFVEVAPEVFEGLGQRMWATDAGEYAILETRSIELDQPELPGGDEGAEGDG
jgi:type VI secretion system protein ImpE